MGTGLGPVFVISWAQTLIEGSPAKPEQDLAEGMTWRWQGRALALEGDPSALLLTANRDNDELRTRAARVARKMVERVVPCPAELSSASGEDPLLQGAFVVTDGLAFFTLVPIFIPSHAASLVLFLGPMPPSDRDLTIVQSDVSQLSKSAIQRKSVLCFTPGTLLSTEDGQVPIEDLGPGDRIQTRDHGPQEIVWMGHRRMSGARLFAMPQDRPVVLRRNACAPGQPCKELIVSPDHRVLIEGEAARVLWGEAEVLVRAADLVGDGQVSIDHSLKETHYIHLMMERHEIVWANGQPVETLHPAELGLEDLDHFEKGSLLELLPDLEVDAYSYGPSARRMLSQAEAAILQEGFARHGRGLH